MPPCERCGAPRCFEMQLIPSLLFHFGELMQHPGLLMEERFFDWNSLYVFTCSRQCEGSPKQGTAAREFVVWE